VSGLQILFASAEAAPYAKVGGLADVVGSLPQALAALGHEVSVALPLYGTIDRARWGIGAGGESLAVPFAGAEDAVVLRETSREGVRIVLFDDPKYLGRPRVYGEADDPKRFAFFCRAVAEFAARWRPDVVHAHDWHAGLIPQLLRQPFAERLPATASAFTIHNLAYQGVTRERILQAVGLPEDRLLIEKKRYGKQIDPMARGIAFADVVSTVSPRYAQEILTPEFGEGLEPLLEERRNDVYGILNGIDTTIFDPARDPHIVATYSADDPVGKSLCKAALQEEFALAEDPSIPLVGVVGRLVEQKGVDLLVAVLPQLLSAGAQAIILGTGEPAYERRLKALAAKVVDSFGLQIGFDAALAQRIYAGADLFLMPSRFEPCGLGQLISLRYGTVPVVHAVGGLADTVRDADARPEDGNGFAFGTYAAPAFMDACRRAMVAFRDSARWARLIVRGMREDHSWAASAREYVSLYETALENRTRAEGVA
jgi:starch synthase